MDPETGKVIRERQARAPSVTKPAQMDSSFQVWNSEPSEVIRERWKDMFYAVLLETPSWHKKVPSLRALGPDSPILLSGVWAVPACGPANESVSNPGHYHGGLAPASNSRGFWIVQSVISESPSASAASHGVQPPATAVGERDPDDQSPSHYHPWPLYRGP